LRLVGISGKKRRGKDALGAVLLGFGFARRAYADPIKEAANAFLFCGVKNNVSDKTPFQRSALQLLGTEHGREFWAHLMDKHPEKQTELLEAGWQWPHSLWLHHFERYYWQRLAAGQDNPGIFVPDVRFPDEADQIHALGGVMIRIERPDADQSDRENLPKGWKALWLKLTRRFPKEHVSETALDRYNGFDLVIINDGTLYQLRSLICEYHHSGKLYERRETPLRVSVTDHALLQGKMRVAAKALKASVIRLQGATDEL
jgi:hypothetical protein